MDFKTLAHIAAHGRKGLTLESLDDDLPEGGEATVNALAEECDNSMAQTEEASEAMEAIRDYADQLSALINRGEVSMVALSLIRQGVAPHTQRLGRDLILPALESAETVDVDTQATIALEGMRNYLNNVIQEFVIGFKHHKDTIADLLKTVSELTAKYEKKTLENKRQWNSVKGDLAGGDVSVGANGLLYFFAKGRGANTVGKLFGKGALLKALEEDVKISKYILTVYPKEVIGEMRALSTILRGASFRKPSDMVRMAQQVERLKTPTELFDEKHHGADLLGATSLKTPEARQKKIKISEHAKPMPRLATMAGARHIGYASDKNMTMIRAGHAVNSTPAHIALGAAVTPGLGAAVATIHHMTNTLPMAAGTSTPETSYTFAVSDIPKIFDIADDYLSNVRTCIGFERELVRAIDELDAALEKVSDSSDELVDEIQKIQDKAESEKAWNEFIEACHLFEHVSSYAQALRRAIQRPTHGELARALRASKYTNYLGLRAIFNAERKKDEKPATESVATEAQGAITGFRTRKQRLDQTLDGLKADNAKISGAADQIHHIQELTHAHDQVASKLSAERAELMDELHAAKTEEQIAAVRKKLEDVKKKIHDALDDYKQKMAAAREQYNTHHASLENIFDLLQVEVSLEYND
jgi:hypothetical protein